MSKAIHFGKPFKDDMWAKVPREMSWPNGWGRGMTRLAQKHIFTFFSLFRSKINSIL